MYLMDYHHHTNYSHDSNAIMEDVCKNAIERGIKEICFTEHFSLNPLVNTYDYLDFGQYLKNIKECQIQFGHQLIIKAGVEICEPHQLVEEYRNLLDPLKLDFILGSVHNIENNKLRIFMENKEKEEVYRGYFTELYEMVSLAEIDVIAHLDLMKRYALSSYGNYEFIDYKDLLQAILKKAIDRHIGIEINTSGLRGELNETLPTFSILKLYKELGGEILTIGSDSHEAENVGAGLIEAYQMAKEAGFKYIFHFEKRQPIAVAL
ncbi:histidinol-phosphatase HisJ family protein [Bacillus massilinigeriensis]|uniref:histidinol-phosphatase HisJ family protein n=1 Tax=Bacillus massilionigeriensis TaxID=1805475 RepID=UPI00096AFCE7|nr:histidinol-phosphatase HisJ family protein [Bacillus massilionigeriensis]